MLQNWIELKKASIILFLLALVCLKSNSQEFIYNRGLATLSIGVAMPSYDYGKRSGLQLSSYVKAGTNISGEVSYFTNWNFGVNFMFTYTVNPVNVDRLADAYMEASPAFVTAKAEAEAFRDFAGLGGFIFVVPMNDYLSLTFKTMGGLRNIYKPTSVVRTTTVFSAVDYYETHDSNLVVAFLFSAGGKMIVNDYFNIHFNISYMGSHFNLEYYRNSKLINQEAHIGLLIFNGGVSYAF